MKLPTLTNEAEADNNEAVKASSNRRSDKAVTESLIRSRWRQRTKPKLLLTKLMKQPSTAKVDEAN